MASPRSKIQEEISYKDGQLSKYIPGGSSICEKRSRSICTYLSTIRFYKD